MSSKERVWQDMRDYKERRKELRQKGMQARLTLQWLPAFYPKDWDHASDLQFDLLAFVVTPVQGRTLHIRRPPIMHISIAFRDEVEGLDELIAKVYRRWNNKIVRLKFHHEMNTSVYLDKNTAFVKDKNLMKLHAKSRRYKDRDLHISM
jgi:hypothetical protein